MEQGKQQTQLTSEQIIIMVIQNLGGIKVPVSLYDEVSVPILNGIENLLTVIDLCKITDKKIQELMTENEALKAKLVEEEPIKANYASADPYPENFEDKRKENNQNGNEC